MTPQNPCDFLVIRYAPAPDQATSFAWVLLARSVADPGRHLGVVAATGWQGRVRPEHREYLRELKAKGILLGAGPFDPRTGGALLVRVPTESAQEALTAVRDGDPFFSQGIANYELIAWNVVIGNEGLDKL